MGTVKSMENRARELDESDELAYCRDLFHIPLAKNTYPETGVTDDRKCIYFNGNSLGCMPKSAEVATNRVLDDWRTKGMLMHMEGFLPAIFCDEKLLPMMAKVIGAQENEIALMNGLTVNLKLMMDAFYRPSGNRTKILIEHGAFPSDYYCCASQIELNKLDPKECLVEIKSESGILSTEAIIAKIEELGDELALVLFPGVQYYTGQVFDMKSIIEASHRVGAVCGLDLAHAVGNVSLDLHNWAPDFAVWSNYKYMNGSPGALGGAFISNSVDVKSMTKARGWWGHKIETRFKMDNQWDGSGGISEFRLCNPPPVLAAPLYASLEVFDSIGMDKLRAKGLQLSGFMIELLEDKFHDQVKILTPKDEKSRGCQVSFMLDDSVDIAEVFKRLRRQGVVCDFREPNSIRTAA